MSGFIDYSNEPSVSLKKEFYSVAVRLLASKEKFWSMKLVDFVVVKYGELKGTSITLCSLVLNCVTELGNAHT
jgi:hypothetical protein